MEPPEPDEPDNGSPPLVAAALEKSPAPASSDGGGDVRPASSGFGPSERPSTALNDPAYLEALEEALDHLPKVTN